MNQTPQVSPKPTAQQTASGCGCLLVILAALALGIGMCTNSSPSNPNPEQLSSAGLLEGDDVSTLLERCGPPTSDTSSAYENPRPLIVTRMVTWADQNVRAIYVPQDAVAGQAPSYAGWKLIGLTDPAREVKLTAAEAAYRLQSICKKK